MAANWNSPDKITHALRLLKSFQRWTGKELIPKHGSCEEIARQLFEAPFVVVSHGTEPDPILNYGNTTALQLWDMKWETFTRTPSRFTAEPPNRDERARLLAQVTSQGWIPNYSGIRIASNGIRFRIDHAIVWNLLDDNGLAAGQAATFAHWEWLESASP